MQKIANVRAIRNDRTKKQKLSRKFLRQKYVESERFKKDCNKIVGAHGKVAQIDASTQRPLSLRIGIRCTRGILSRKLGALILNTKARGMRRGMNARDM